MSLPTRDALRSRTSMSSTSTLSRCTYRAKTHAGAAAGRERARRDLLPPPTLIRGIEGHCRPPLHAGLPLARAACGGVPRTGVQGLENTGKAVCCQHGLTPPGMNASRAARIGVAQAKGLIWRVSASFPWICATNRVIRTPPQSSTLGRLAALRGTCQERLTYFLIDSKSLSGRSFPLKGVHHEVEQK